MEIFFKEKDFAASILWGVEIGEVDPMGIHSFDSLVFGVGHSLSLNATPTTMAPEKILGEAARGSEIFWRWPKASYSNAIYVFVSPKKEG